MFNIEAEAKHLGEQLKSNLEFATAQCITSELIYQMIHALQQVVLDEHRRKDVRYSFDITFEALRQFFGSWDFLADRNITLQVTSSEEEKTNKVFLINKNVSVQLFTIYYGLFIEPVNELEESED